MMRPKLYKAACAALMGSKGDGLIDYDLDAAQDDPVELEERLSRTRVVYRILFGHEAPFTIWENNTSDVKSLSQIG